MALVYRLVKGAPLTYSEADNNFAQLADFSSGVHTGFLAELSIGGSAKSVNVGGVTYNAAFQLNDIGTAHESHLTLHRHSTTIPPTILGAYTNSETQTHIAVALGQTVLQITGTATAGANYKPFGQIQFAAETAGTISDTSAPGRMLFQVTPNGSIVPETALTISNNKAVTLAGALTVTGMTNLGSVSLSCTVTTKLPLSAGTLSNASLQLPHGVAPTTPVDGDMWTTTAGLFVQINGATIGPLGTGGGGSYLPLSGGTLTGLLTTVATTATTAGLRLPHGTEPTTPVNGDVWTTTTGLYVRINGTTVGPLGVSGGGSYLPLSGGTLTGLVTFVAGSTSSASINLQPGTAPTTPVNGDMWSTSGGLYAYVAANTFNLTHGTLQRPAFGAAEYDAGNSGTAATITWSNGQNQKLTLTGNVTITFASPIAGMTAKLKLVQGAGPYTITWPTIKWAGATAPTLSTASGAVDIVSLYYDGTNYYGIHSANFG